MAYTSLFVLILSLPGPISAQVRHGRSLPDAARPQPPDHAGSGSSGSGYSMAGLNQLGADVTMPPFSDSIVGSNTEFRRMLYSHGLMLRVLSVDSFAVNTLQAPVSAADQEYAVPTREYQTDQSSPILPRLRLALFSKNKNHPTAVQRLTGSLHIRACRGESGLFRLMC